jgi:hypothetical protein
VSRIMREAPLRRDPLPTLRGTPGCLPDERRREELDAKNKGLTEKNLRERIKAAGAT